MDKGYKHVRTSLWCWCRSFGWCAVCCRSYNNQLKFLRSVEAYNLITRVWTIIAGMHSPRQNAGVVPLDGLLYAVGGYDGTSVLDSIECYCLRPIPGP